jgi:hypothetical protein
MRRIRSGRWLDVATTGTEKYAIQESACLEYSIDALPNPAAQHPRLWVFLGSSQKNQYLHGIFPQNSFTRTELGTVRLRGDVTSSTSDSPVLFVDGDPWNASAVPDSRYHRGQSEYSLDWVAETASDVTHCLYSRVLFQFADIVCAFVEDFPTGADFATLLASHASVPLRARPRLVLVVGGSDSSTSWSGMVDSARVSEVFATVSVFPVARGKAAQSRAFDRLRTLLETHSQDAQTQRRGIIGQLSGFQLRAFLRSAVVQLAKSRKYTLDFVRESRAPHGIPRDTGSAVKELYKKCVDAGLHDRDSARFIASALIMDHYGPEMPRKFIYQSFWHTLTVELRSDGPTASISHFISPYHASCRSIEPCPATIGLDRARDGSRICPPLHFHIFRPTKTGTGCQKRSLLCDQVESSVSVLSRSGGTAFRAM